MQTFNNIKFNGTFRSYQQNVLNKSTQHLSDGKIHIVAAPGSGKTILGLELIRRLAQPALVLSPSVIIRQQWGERFEENFIPDGQSKDGYISYSLRSPSLITSVTYQALHAAFTQKQSVEERDEDEEETEQSVDFSNFDLISAIKAAGIKTICLDEAHHLRSEWQKALEGFIEAIKSDVKIIALTATPPYDSTPAEWKKYSGLCGEIDEEIFVPQLVAQKTLCPHQDYIMFNYPTEAEKEIINSYRDKAAKCAEEIINGGLFKEAVDKSQMLTHTELKEETILDHPTEFNAMVSLLRAGNVQIPDKLLRLTAPRGKLMRADLSAAETAFDFIISSPEIFGEEIAEKIRATLSSAGLIEKKKVCLVSTEKITKGLVTSSGKLSSIARIVKSEKEGLGDKLRMLILTDFIKKDMLNLIATNQPITAMGTVPVFETVRRSCGEGTKAALLSGTLAVLPDSACERVNELACDKGVKFSVKSVGGGYSEAIFSGSNKNKVGIITEAFGEGLFNVLIGTKSLLGEGWDSPCINSLILASFVGSFMLSNQMRGRAIRMDKANPDKASNIWHLVTVFPQENSLDKSNADYSEIGGSDYDSVKRRFECFLAPSYHGNSIESGIERLDIIKPPFNESGIENINTQMLALSADRESMKRQWNNEVKNPARSEILETAEITEDMRPKGFIVKNILMEVIIAAILAAVIIFTVGMAGSEETNTALRFILFGVYTIIGIFAIRGLFRIFKFITPEKTIHSLAYCVLKTLKQIGEIQSSDVSLKTECGSDGKTVYCSIENGTAHEKNVFMKAISELLSSIDNPRYLLIRESKLTKILNYNDSFACPEIIGTKKEYAEILAQALKKYTGKYVLAYTRNENGNKVLLMCRKLSRMNICASRVRNKKRVK